jgi:hypothetical protein
LLFARGSWADRRPQGWDLAMDPIRIDFGDQELAVLERQLPGLSARPARPGRNRRAAAVGATATAASAVPAIVARQSPT